MKDLSLVIAFACLASIGSLTFAEDALFCKGDAQKRSGLMSEMDYLSNMGKETIAQSTIVSAKAAGDGAFSSETYVVDVVVTDTEGTTCKPGGQLYMGRATLVYHLGELCYLQSYQLEQNQKCL